MVKNVELARRVVKHVLDHPVQYVWGLWVDDELETDVYCSLPYRPVDAIDVDALDLPEVSCETTGCLAGWTVLLGRGTAGVAEVLLKLRDPNVTIVAAWFKTAAAQLGVDSFSDQYAELRELFITQDDDAVGRFADLFGIRGEFPQLARPTR